MGFILGSFSSITYNVQSTSLPFVPDSFVFSSFMVLCVFVIGIVVAVLIIVVVIAAVVDSCCLLLFSLFWVPHQREQNNIVFT